MESRINPIYAAMGTSIFEEISMLAREAGAINLGQGFPDGSGPEDVRRVAAEALIDGLLVVKDAAEGEAVRKFQIGKFGLNGAARFSVDHTFFA